MAEEMSVLLLHGVVCQPYCRVRVKEARAAMVMATPTVHLRKLLLPSHFNWFSIAWSMKGGGDDDNGNGAKRQIDVETPPGSVIGKSSNNRPQDNSKSI